MRLHSQSDLIRSGLVVSIVVEGAPAQTHRYGCAMVEKCRKAPLGVRAMDGRKNGTRDIRGGGCRMAGGEKGSGGDAIGYPGNGQAGTGGRAL